MKDAVETLTSIQKPAIEATKEIVVDTKNKVEQIKKEEDFEQESISEEEGKVQSLKEEVAEEFRKLRFAYVELTGDYRAQGFYAGKKEVN